MWSLPQLDFSADHCYGEPSPAGYLSTLAQSFLQQYGKPVMVGEFGTSAGGWNRTNDPYLRGWRQGIWGGALGGSVGTAMSWWWDNIASEDDYPTYTALGAILNPTGWGIGVWTNIAFQTSNSPPVTVGGLLAGGQPFDVQLTLDGNWGDMTSGKVAVPGPQAAFYSALALNSFVQGYYHPDLRTPFQLNAWLTNGASLVMHLNSVSATPVMMVLVDGAQVFSTNLVDLDNDHAVDEEYNIDIPVPLPAGLHTITITNGGTDWFYLDWVQLNQVLPAAYAGNWQPSPAAIGLRGAHESLLYVVAPDVSFPGSATNAALPVQHAQTLVLTNWPAGLFIANWYDPASATPLGNSQAIAANGGLALAMPDYSEDLAAVLFPPPRLTPVNPTATNGLQLRLDSETGGSYLIQQSSDLVHWAPYLSVTNTIGTLFLSITPGGTNGAWYLRAFRAD
jgi:hypothetical protein